MMMDEWVGWFSALFSPWIATTLLLHDNIIKLLKDPAHKYVILFEFCDCSFPIVR